MLNLLKRVLVAPFFLFLSFELPALNSADYWYKIGYDYSQLGYDKSAFKWMMKAAKTGHSAAQNNIALSYLHGMGVEKNTQEAFLWFEKSAKQGLADAQTSLALLYDQGRGVKQDKQKALTWWSRSALQNDAYAQFNLALSYWERHDKKKSIYWMRQAQANHHPDAKKLLQKIQEYHVD